MARFNREQIKELMEATKSLIESAGEMSEAFQSFSDQVMLTRWSGRNLTLIFGQCPEATNVSGFNQWLDAGRCVRKGETGIAIWCPCKKKAKAGEEENDVYFRIGYVFDISQTDVLEPKTS